MSYSQFQVIFDAALKDYSEKTGKNVVTDPLTDKLKSCKSPDDVLGILQEQVQGFNEFRNGRGRVQFMGKLKPTIDVLFALSDGTSGFLGTAVGLVSAQMWYIFCRPILIFLIQAFPPACAIFAGISFLLAVRSPPFPTSQCG